MKLDVAFKSDQQFGAKIEEKEQSFPVDFSNEDQRFGVVLETAEQSFDVRFQKCAQTLDASFGENLVVEYVEGVPFNGPYEVTPKVDAQVLPTKQKYMKKDLTVLAVPYYEADNENGTTIFIASEV